jgi:hypothetical protein
MEPLHVLAVSVTPVVLISACGLITLALYNRLGAMLAQIRTLHKQKLEAIITHEAQQSSNQAVLLELINSQAAKVTGKAKLIQKGLFCLLSAVVAFLLCSLLGAAATLHALMGVAALTTYVFGLVLFLASIGWALRELTLTLTPLEEERAHLEILTSRLAKAKDHPLRIAEGS